MSSADPFNLIGYVIECLRHSHSTWMDMPLNALGITIQLGSYAVESLRNNHSMVMKMTVFGITIQFGWLCH
jgi:hypothetical protein